MKYTKKIELLLLIRVTNDYKSVESMTQIVVPQKLAQCFSWYIIKAFERPQPSTAEASRSEIHTDFGVIQSETPRFNIKHQRCETRRDVFFLPEVIEVR